MSNYFNDLYKMLVAPTEEESLKIQIRMYDDMILSAEEHMRGLEDVRDDLIYRLKELESTEAQAEVEATDTETVAEPVEETN